MPRPAPTPRRRVRFPHGPAWVPRRWSASRPTSLPPPTGMTTVREPRRLSVILSPEEVARLLDAAPGLNAKAALSVSYGAGLRASEVVSLKVSDIDSARQVIRVEQGKGRKDRYAMLSHDLLELLRSWWRAGREVGVMLPGGWLVRCAGSPRPSAAR